MSEKDIKTKDELINILNVLYYGGGYDRDDVVSYLELFDRVNNKEVN